LLDIWGAVTLRLIASPVLAWAATRLFGIDGLAQSTLIVLASTPTGIITTIIATEFESEPAVVSEGVLASTVASVATLTVLIHMVS
jgi:predicted permease